MAQQSQSGGGSVVVPSQYVSDVQAAASYTGLPYSVVAAQLSDESSFNPGATSPSGAEGIAQFLPSTFANYDTGAPDQPPTPYDVGDAFYAYERYMKQLLNQFGGNVQDALAAYNAGPGNIQAGMGYANSILNAAGEATSLTATGGVTNNGSTSNGCPGFTPDVFTAGGVQTNVQAALCAAENSFLSGILSAFGLTSFSDLLERLGLILLGSFIIIVGAIQLTGRVSSGGNNSVMPPVNSGSAGEAEESGGLASEAGEAAEIA
jgi:Transglycosylase SLT domain